MDVQTRLNLDRAEHAARWAPALTAPDHERRVMIGDCRSRAVWRRICAMKNRKENKMKDYDDWKTVTPPYLEACNDAAEEAARRALEDWCRSEGNRARLHELCNEVNDEMREAWEAAGGDPEDADKFCELEDAYLTAVALSQPRGKVKPWRETGMRNPL